MKIGVLTSGGDSPGMNTAIRSVVRQAIADRHEVVGFYEGVEVMGRQSGAIALHSGLAGGADYIILPGTPYDVGEICTKIDAGFRRGKNHYLVVVAEGAGSAFSIGQEIKDCGGYDIKITVLGHIQRGGSPSAQDRLAASVLGAKAVKELAADKSGVMVGLIANQVRTLSFSESFRHKQALNMELYELARTLAM